MHREFQQISLKAIDQQDAYFRFTFAPEIKGLITSIRQAGLLTPIFLRTQRNSLQIIAGFRRIAAVTECGLNEVPAFIYHHISDKEALLISMHQSIFARPLNLIEKANILSKFMGIGLSQEEIITIIMPVMGIAPSPKLLQDYPALRDLPDEVKYYIVENNFVLINALKFLKFPPSQLQVLVNFLNRYHMGNNQFKEIITLLYEISRRDGIGINTLLSKQEIIDIEKDDRLSQPQRFEAVKRFLKSRRLPHLSRMEEEFEKAVKELKLPPFIRISPPLFFEGDRYKLEASFSSENDIKKIIERLQLLISINHYFW